MEAFVVSGVNTFGFGPVAIGQMYFGYSNPYDL
jgi:hypothetical protein